MKRLISIAVSVIILAIIYSKIDFPKLIQAFQQCDGRWMAISLGMVVPITLITAWRLQQLMPTGSQLGFGEANRLILAASVLNMVLPSKMGDIAKAYFMKQRGHLEGTLSLSLVIFEKACDMLSLLLWCVFGLLLYPPKDWPKELPENWPKDWKPDWLFGVIPVAVFSGLVIGLLLLSSPKFAHVFFLIAKKYAPKKLRSKLEKLQISWGEMHGYFWRDKAQLTKISVTSVFIWFLHLLQIWFFILALKGWTPFITSLALSPLAILAGLLPLTFAGAGTRDAALIFFYFPYLGDYKAGALGILCTSRYLLPAIGGLPFLRNYLSTVRDLQRQPR